MQVQCLWDGIGKLTGLQTLVLENIEVDEDLLEPVTGEAHAMPEEFWGLSELRWALQPPFPPATLNPTQAMCQSWTLCT